MIFNMVFDIVLKEDMKSRYEENVKWWTNEKTDNILFKKHCCGVHAN